MLETLSFHVLHHTATGSNGDSLYPDIVYGKANAVSHISCSLK